MAKSKEKIIFNALCRESFYAFVKKAFNETHGSEHFHDSFAIELICDRLEKCMRGEIRKLIINIPPRNLKSFITSVCLPAYLLGKDPQKEIVCVSYSSDLANKLSRDTKSIMEMPFYKDIFATRIGKKNTEDMFETTKHDSRAATTVQGALTGLGGNYLILDDPCSAADVLSDVKRKNLNDWFRNTFLSRLNNKKNGVMIVIMQRLHEKDLTGLLKEHNGWEVLSLPAIAEKDEKFVLSDGRIVGRKAGEVLNPEHEPLEILLDLKNAMSEYNFSAQYQQKPISEKGNIIDFNDFKIYNYNQLPQDAEVIFSWDIAQKDGTNNDYSVCITAIYWNKKLYILDIWREKLEINELVKTIAYKAKNSNKSHTIIEESPVSEHLIQILENNYSMYIERYNPKGLNKSVRAQNANYYIKNGVVLIPDNSPWIKDFKDEIISFPYGKHDDQADALSQLILCVFGKEEAAFGSSDNIKNFLNNLNNEISFQKYIKEMKNGKPEIPFEICNNFYMKPINNNNDNLFFDRKLNRRFWFGTS